MNEVVKSLGLARDPISTSSLDFAYGQDLPGKVNGS
jgi:hypothetical protein